MSVGLGTRAVEPILMPDENASDDGVIAFVSREAFPEPDAAIVAAVREVEGPGRDSAGMRAVPILMRQVSEVEAKINGWEVPFWVPCTTRAKAHLPYWKVTCDG